MYYDPAATGERIQNLRKDREVTQEQLAIDLNISDRYMRNLEKGEKVPSVDLFVELRERFGSSLDYIVLGVSASQREQELQLSTCERIAAQNGVGAATVKRAEKYAKGVDAAEDAVPGAREEILTGRIKATDAEITALAKTPKAEIPAALAELRKPKQERQPRKAETASSKQTLSEISKSIQGHQRQLTTEERTFLKASIDNRYQERAVANGSLMMCEVQGAKEDFIRRWNSIFKEYPDVFEDSDCRKIIHDLIEDAVQYLLKIKEKTL